MSDLHGPDNAEHELRKAYNCVINASVAHFWDRRSVPGVNAHEVISIYKQAHQAYRKGDKLAAERWARAAKHLSRAFSAEAKIAYLEPRAMELPFLNGATPEEYEITHPHDSAADLLDSVKDAIPAGLHKMPEDMARYQARARKHLETLGLPDYKHELLRAERVKAAHEYGRVIECMALAYEAESSHRDVA